MFNVSSLHVVKLLGGAWQDIGKRMSVRTVHSLLSCNEVDFFQLFYYVDSRLLP